MADQREQEIAIMEGEMAAASDAYFDARPHLDSKACRITFDAGFQKGWNRAQAQPTADDQPANRITAAEAKKIATQFFYWWHNQPGSNAERGFDYWWAPHGAEYAAAPADDQARRDAVCMCLNGFNRDCKVHGTTITAQAASAAEGKP